MNKEDQLQLKGQFYKETGMMWENSDKEPDIDYVEWLEAKVIAAQNDVSGNVANPLSNKKAGEVALPVEDVNSVIEMLKQHHYTQEEMDECGWDANKIEHLDAHAFDNSVMINLLGGKLDRQ